MLRINLSLFIVFVSSSFSNIVFAGTPLKVGICFGPSQIIMELAKKIAKNKYDLNIKTIPFSNYQIPNEALNSGDIDVNVFQTQSFLEHAIANRGYELSVIGNTFIYPMGLYSRKVKQLSAIEKNSVIVIPNDASNQGRALILLQNAKLIELRKGSGKVPVPQDIVKNPMNIKIQSLDGAQIARVTQDATAVVLNNDFVQNAGFNPSEALFRETTSTAKPYVNVIVVRSADQNKKELKNLVDVLNSDEILQKTQELYPGAIPAW